MCIRDSHNGHRTPAHMGAFTQHVHGKRESGASEKESGHVKRAGIRFRVLVEIEQAKNKGRQSQGDVHEENPAPGRLFNDRTADDWTKSGTENCGKHHDPANADTFLWWKRAIQHRHSNWSEHTAANTLEDAKHHQLGK